MIGDLPELGDIFNNDFNPEDNVDIGNSNKLNKDIYIYLSKGDNKWIPASYLDLAPGGIGLHVILPLEIEFSLEDLKNIHIKFEKKTKNSNVILKEAPVLIRWQERDHVSGRMKLGVHFHGDVKIDHDIVEILKTLNAQNQ